MEGIFQVLQVAFLFIILFLCITYHSVYCSFYFIIFFIYYSIFFYLFYYLFYYLPYLFYYLSFLFYYLSFLFYYPFWGVSPTLSSFLHYETSPVLEHVSQTGFLFNSISCFRYHISLMASFFSLFWHKNQILTALYTYK